MHDHSSGPEITGRVGFNGQANGYANDSFNGSDNGLSNGHHAGSNGTLNGNAHYTRSHSSENCILNGNIAETSQSLNGYRSGSANLNGNSTMSSNQWPSLVWLCDFQVGFIMAMISGIS